jgi:hypothetical protein
VGTSLGYKVLGKKMEKKRLEKLVNKREVYLLLKFNVSKANGGALPAEICLG